MPMPVHCLWRCYTSYKRAEINNKNKIRIALRNGVFLEPLFYLWDLNPDLCYVYLGLTSGIMLYSQRAIDCGGRWQWGVIRGGDVPVYDTRRTYKVRVIQRPRGIWGTYLDRRRVNTAWPWRDVARLKRRTQKPYPEDRARHGAGIGTMGGRFIARSHVWVYIPKLSFVKSKGSICSLVR